MTKLPSKGPAMSRTLLVIAVAGLSVTAFAAADQGWMSLIDDRPLEAWRKPTGAWYEAGDARPDPKDPRRLIPLTGKGVLVNGRSGRTANLLSKAEFGDV